MFESMRNKWAVHLDDYSIGVNLQDNIDILELATGAGLGSCAVMKNLNAQSRIISADIDFAAAKNADGIAKFLNIDERACGINANFWCLPFINETFDVVCSHYGLDEAGEIPKVVEEAARVLKTMAYLLEYAESFLTIGTKEFWGCLV